MREGYLQRAFTAELASGKKLAVNAKRFCSIVDEDAGAIKYCITPLNFDGDITINAFIDGDVSNKDSNYDEKFWDHVSSEADQNEAYLTITTKKTSFDVCTGSCTNVLVDGKAASVEFKGIAKDKYVATTFTIPAKQGQEITITKYVAECIIHGSSAGGTIRCL